MTTSRPVLANYKSLNDYRPAYGDFVIWTGWFNVWYGLVVDCSDGNLSIIFGSGTPVLLFQMLPELQQRNTHIVPLTKILGSYAGTWTIQQHDRNANCDIWYL